MFIISKNQLTYWYNLIGIQHSEWTMDIHWVWHHTRCNLRATITRSCNGKVAFGLPGFPGTSINTMLMFFQTPNSKLQLISLRLMLVLVSRAPYGCIRSQRSKFANWELMAKLLANWHPAQVPSSQLKSMSHTSTCHLGASSIMIAW